MTGRIAVMMLAAWLVSTTGSSPLLAERTAWTTSRVHGSPEPPSPYVLQRAFPALKFREVVEVERLPGTDRLAVVEREGKIWTFAPAQLSDDPRCGLELAADLRQEIDGLQQIYGFTVHPDFAENRECFVCYVRADGQPEGTHVVRLKMSSGAAPRIDAQSAQTVITWVSGGHNGGCLRFGPDRLLYISTGDAAGPNPPDTLRTGQDCSDLLSSVLRIDVDHATQDQGYRIPADNPFVDQPGIRPEIWAYGFRNPWKMSFDAPTGALWVGDVGWELWELVFRVERGGNYGWSIMEGQQPTNPEWPRGPTPILPPVADHPHTEAASITGGIVYRGPRHAELQGSYIYGDFETGKIWALSTSPTDVQTPRELTDSSLQIIAFGLDHENELIIADYYGGGLYRLERREPSGLPPVFPVRLSETGIFADTASQQPAPGVVPFEPTAPMWHDGARSEYWIGVPGDAVLRDRGETHWELPLETVLVKTVSLPLDARHPDQNLRRLETQLLHRTDDGWRAYVFAWDEDQLDAQLVPIDGSATDVERISHEGHVEHRVWRHMARAECMRCHNRMAGVILGFNRWQLADAQRTALAQAGLFDEPPAASDDHQLVPPHGDDGDLARRARSYLHANCGHCHRDGGGSAAILKLHVDAPLEQANLVDARPSLGTFGIPGGQIVTPGDAASSVMVYRMSKLGGGRMPHLGSQDVDAAGLRLVRDWIDHLPDRQPSTAEPNETNDQRRRLRVEDQQRLDRLRQADSAATDTVDGLLGTASGALRLVDAIDRAAENSGPKEWVRLALNRGHQHADPAIRELFERYLPYDQRPKRLGARFDPQIVLSLTGDAERGRELFQVNTVVQCRNCHRRDGQGGQVGPDLSEIGKKYDRAQLLEQIVAPSRRIESQYETYLVETADGHVLVGWLRHQDDASVEVQSADGRTHRVARSEIVQQLRQPQSLMPEGVGDHLSAQQLADLLEYLGQTPSKP
ncbi:MAG: PQQ-dependent sugar dehydrogenase [Pirellulales bacterium]